VSPDAWLDLIVKRSLELRRAGILSIGCDGNSVVLAPAEPEIGDDDRAPQERPEPSNPWENPASYPTGTVPTLGDVDERLPEIPIFGDD
jgi:hypothetical protein